MFLHPILNRQSTDFEPIAFDRVGILGGIGGNRAGLFGECQVGITGTVGFHHSLIARKRRRDAEFLLGPIHIGHRVSFRGFDQSPQPNRGAEDKPIV